MDHGLANLGTEFLTKMFHEPQTILCAKIFLIKQNLKWRGVSAKVQKPSGSLTLK